MFSSGFQQRLFSPILKKNRQFKNLHKGETCYIFGNGASLKSMDLSCFSDKLSIGLNFICIHSQFKELNAPYYVIPAPMFLYPFYRNPYTEKIQVSPTIRAFRKAISQFPDINLFTSISNYFGYSAPRNNFYMHHFGYDEPDADYCDLSSIFSFMKGGLYSGIGVAIYMGFKKVILVGCDYLFTPIQGKHFYSGEAPVRSNRTENVYASLLGQASRHLEISLITDDNESRWLPYETYEQATGKKLQYRKNLDLVSKEYLDDFDRAYKCGLYSSPIYKEGVTV